MRRNISRLLSILLVLCMALALLPGTAWGAATSGKCGDNVTWSYSNGTLTIQGTGTMENYGGYDYLGNYMTSPWIDRCNEINAVKIGDGVTTIGGYAFAQCKNITSVTIPDSVISITDGAFVGCSKLTSVTIPNDVVHIGIGTFSGCSSLTSVIIPGGVATIDMEAFDSCTSLTSVTIPASVTRIGAYAFGNCISLKNVYYGGSEIQWKRIDIWDDNSGTNTLLKAKIHYNSTDFTTSTTREDWSEAFYSFTLGGGFWNSGQLYYHTTAYDAVRFGLHDLDGDGVPELIAYNNCDFMAGMMDYIYAYQNGKVTYLGEAGFRGYNFVYAPGSGYPGLFFQSGNAGGYPGYYYTVQNGQLKEEFVLYSSDSMSADHMILTETQKTSDDTLYGLFSGYFDGAVSGKIKAGLAELSMLTIDEIRAKGWDNFVAQSMASDNTLFTDVNIGDYFFKPVKWAVEKGVTSGTGSGAFSPNANSTRSQIVTFLWRAYGQPEPTSTVNQFTDVSRDAYYYKAVLWAAEKGITSGTGGTNFGINGDCTRAQAVTFLWRAAGQPTAKSNSSFSDVDNDAYYTEAVKWAVENNITSGTGNGRFSPDQVCTRAQIVTFLYRALG